MENRGVINRHRHRLSYFVELSANDIITEVIFGAFREEHRERLVPFVGVTVFVKSELTTPLYADFGFVVFCFLARISRQPLHETLINGFLDENSFWNARLRRERIAVLQNELRLLRQKYEEDTRRYEMLSQRHELERVAREKYHMKRADEDIFVIYDAEKEQQPQPDSMAYMPIER